MRKVLTSIAVLLLIVTAILLARDASQPAAQLWASFDPNSLVGLQSLVEKQIDPDLWFNRVLPVLTWPAWVFPGGLGLLLILLARPWASRRRRRGVVEA